MGVAILMLFVAPLCNLVYENKLRLTAIVVPVNIYCDKYKLMNTVCRYTVQCVGTQYGVSVHHKVCRYTIRCVGTPYGVSVHHTVCRYTIRYVGRQSGV
jgi:ribosomal protein L32